MIAIGYTASDLCMIRPAKKGLPSSQNQTLAGNAGTIRNFLCGIIPYIQ